MTSGKSVALVQSRAAPSTGTRATDFPAVTNVGYCPRVRAITNTFRTIILPLFYYYIYYMYVVPCVLLKKYTINKVKKLNKKRSHYL